MNNNQSIINKELNISNLISSTHYSSEGVLPGRAGNSAANRAAPPAGGLLSWLCPLNKYLHKLIRKFYSKYKARGEDCKDIHLQRVTQYLPKIFLPKGNYDFDQFLRCSSSMWLLPLFRRHALNLIQNH